MRIFLNNVFLTLSVLGLVGCPSGGTDQQADFTQAYLEAHASEDVEAVLALHCLDGVTEEDAFLIRQAILQELTYPVRSLSFEPVTEEDSYRYEYEGKTWEPNLQPAIRVLIVFDNEERLHSSFLLGEKDGKLVFVNPRPKG